MHVDSSFVLALAAAIWHPVATQNPRPYTAAWARQHYPPGELSDCVWARAQVPGGFPAWDMCTYPKRYDVWLSRRIQDNKCFECDTVSLVLRLLRGARKRMDAGRVASHDHSRCGRPDPMTTPLLTIIRRAR